MSDRNVEAMLAPRLDRGPVREVRRRELTDDNRQYSWVVEGRRLGWENAFRSASTEQSKIAVTSTVEKASAAIPQAMKVTGLDTPTVGELISEGRKVHWEGDTIVFGLRSPAREPWSRRVSKFGIQKGPGRHKHNHQSSR